MKTFAATLFAAVASAELMTSLDYEFMRYVSEHGKQYATIEEFKVRQQAFALVDEYIQMNNSNPNSTHVAGHNFLSDMLPAEKDKMLGLKNMPKPEVSLAVDEVDISNLPESWDWRAQGKVTAVKDQGQCGSCWAFSTIEAIESAWMIAGHAELIMSEQQLIDCSQSVGNMGCEGGWYFWTYDWLSTHRTMKEADYPYTGRDDQCQNDGTRGVTTVSNYGKTQGTDANLARLAQQPVNVAVAAGNNVFSSYQSGIITASSGCPTEVDHAILAVGWGVENGTQYYIVRNSWGTGWGEQGYIRIATADDLGVCGINKYVQYPNL